DVAITNGEHHILLFSSAGKAIRFDESDVRSMGRTARGVIGLRLADDATLVSMIVADGRAILTATQNGFGKRTALEEFPSHRRGGQGVIAVQTNNRNGDCVGAVQVCDDDEVMLISNAGTLVRTRVEEISVQGRNTQGVTLIRLGDEEDLVGIAPIESMEDEDAENDLEDAEQTDDGDEAGPSDPEPRPDPEPGPESDPEPDA
ncbi:MAG: DNA gyrase C-terminal beta-propeller domain-containing protein, partial [Pseudomonadota bacterium]